LKNKALGGRRHKTTYARVPADHTAIVRRTGYFNTVRTPPTTYMYVCDTNQRKPR
jgi:hypothetical protein